MSDNKIQISPLEDYNDIKKLLNTTVIEISSDSEDDEVTYIKTTPSHPRDRLRRKLNKKDEGEVVQLVNENDDIDFRRVTPSHPRDRLRRKVRNRDNREREGPYIKKS